jgi:hypothetical protein
MLLDSSRILRCHDIMEKWFSSTWKTSNHRNASHISRYSMMYRLTKHRGDGDICEGRMMKYSILNRNLQKFSWCIFGIEDLLVRTICKFWPMRFWRVYSWNGRLKTWPVKSQNFPYSIVLLQKIEAIIPESMAIELTNGRIGGSYRLSEIQLPQNAKYTG